jgi:EmrB/QacA subfamily drug resistance transporter
MGLTWPAGRRQARQLSRPAPSRGWALVLTSAAFFMVALDALVVITALPTIHHDLGGSVSTLEWTVNAYTLSFAAGIITAAAIGDRLGRRRVYVAGLLLFTAASAACALAPTAGTLIAARAVQGIGAAIVTPLSLTILTGAWPAQRRGAIVGIWGGIAGLAVAAGPLVGGAVVYGLNWHWIFWVNVPIGLAAAVGSLAKLSETRGPATRLDIPGVVLVTAGAGGILWGLVRGGEAGWGTGEVIAAFVAGAAALAGFAAWERRAPEPMLPWQLMRIRSFAAANATGFLQSAALFSAAFLAAQYFQMGLGFSPLGAGLRFLPWTATPAVVAPLAGRLTDRLGPRPLMVLGLVMQAAGFAWIAVLATATVSYAQLVLPFIIAGVGISMVVPATPTAALSAVPPVDIGKASGVNNTLQRFGGVFGVAVVTAVFTATGHLGAPEQVAAGFRPSLAVSAGLSVLGAATALAVTRRRRPGPAAPQPATEHHGTHQPAEPLPLTG